MYKSKKVNRKAIFNLKMKRLSSKNGWFFACVLAVALLVSVFFNIYTPMKKNAEYNKTVSMYETSINNLHDSLTYELNYAKTLSERCHIYTEIGKVSVERNSRCDFNSDTVWEYIKSLGVWYPEYIMAQAIIESQCGQVTPHKSNNLFGMTIPQRRETTALPPTSKNDIYAKYKNWKMSVIDRILWELDAFNNIQPNEEKYLSHISCYAKSPTYLENVIKTSKKYKNLK